MKNSMWISLIVGGIIFTNIMAIGGTIYVDGIKTDAKLLFYRLNKRSKLIRLITHSSPFHSNFSGIIGEHLKSGSMNTFESIPKAAMNAAGASLGGVNRCL